MEEPYAAWHLLLMPVTHCCVIASHSSTSICCKSVIEVVLFTPAPSAHPSWSHKHPVRLMSGLYAGYFMLSTPTFWRYSLWQTPLCGGQLSSWIEPLVAKSHVSFCIENACSFDQPNFSSERDAAPDHPTASTRSCHPLEAAIHTAFSGTSSHFDSTIQTAIGRIWIHHQCPGSTCYWHQKGRHGSQ